MAIAGRVNERCQRPSCFLPSCIYALSAMLLMLAQITPLPASEKSLVTDTSFRLQQAKSPSKNSTRLSFDAFLEATGGYDSNANSTSDVITFKDIDLISEDVNAATSYILLKVGTDLYAQRGQNNSYRFVAMFSQRENQDSQSVAYNAGRIQAGWRYRHRYVEQIFVGTLSKTYVRGKYQSYTGALGFGLKFRLMYDADFRVDGSISNTWFDGVLSNQTAVQTMLGVSLYKSVGDTSMSMSVFVGENIPSQNRANAGKKMVGGEIELKRKWGRRFPVLFGLNSRIMSLNYNDVLSDAKREDTLLDLNLMLTRRVLKVWEISVKLAIINNKSKIKRYSYLRVNSGLTLKRLL